MTAEVAILNTHGIALAADSAITVGIGGEKKVYNTGNKLFALSKYYPVGIMVYNRASFMNIDWEIIIKQYRRSLKAKSFPTLLEYANDFLEYIKDFNYISGEAQKQLLGASCYMVFSLIRNTFLDDIEKKFQGQENINSMQISRVLTSTIRSIQNTQRAMDDVPTFKIDVDFVLLHKEFIIEIINDVFEKYPLSDRQQEGIMEILINDLQKGNIKNYTGIVIAGYGEKEIFPSLYNFHIHGKLGNSFIYTNEEHANISSDNSAAILPFAQSEMVHSFMGGIDPQFEDNIIIQSEKIIGFISNIVDKSYKNKLDKIYREFVDYIRDFKQNVYVNPIMGIVDSLQKTDLAEMAESLVNLTSFKRHVSRDTETVGGPTDVAVITKGDGFVWIKRKHYFDIRLNQHFLENYFREANDEQSV
jgi:hypothetical protein